MSVKLIQDLRYGDTGKGKISAYESDPARCDVSVRAVGGGNAGHVIMRDTRKISLHILPAGCIHEGVDLVLGRGMVTHLPTLFDDIREAHAQFQSNPVGRLVIAPENHILLNGHKRADAELERRRGNDTVGTTGSGIGPAYADKAMRVGMRMEALRKSPAELKDMYRSLLLHWAATYNVILTPQEEQQDIETLLKGKDRLEDKIQKDMAAYWQKKFDKQARITIEGAQGSLLSIDNGGYPYVTSSPTTTAGHMQGAGIPVRELNEVIGTFKAYDTRVGGGPLLTRMDAEAEQRFQDKGGERGSTTGRLRSTAWLNLSDTQKRAWEEAVTSLAVLKADIFDGESEIPVAIDVDGEGRPLYKRYPMWKESIRGIRKFDDLPDEAQFFYTDISTRIGTPIRYIGTGPDHDDLIVMD